MSKKLFDDSDHSENELELSTNKDYAKSYNNFRKKELLKKFKDRGYDVSESGSSSDSESTEEEDVADPKFDQEFFQTLASLKSKDPAIYNKNTRFFESLNKGSDGEDNEEGDASTNNKVKSRKEKPVTLKDYERKIILEKGGKFEDDSDNENLDEDHRPASPTLVEEERRLKAEFREALNADDSSDEEFGGIFKKRVKTQAEKEKDEEDFAKWLAGKQQDIDQATKQKLEPLKNYWSSSKLPQSEKFLRDYILNKGYAGTKESEIPTYDEIVNDNAPLSEDEQELEKQAEFEEKFNFRFEEPDTEFIKRYPRTIENSVRRTDDKRKQKRQEIKQRKEEEKSQKLKELELIKEMKRKEIEEKIKKLKMVTGNDELGFKDEELEDDFDPEAHDRRMREIFNDEYYQVDEGEEKPECPSDIDELKIEDWDNYDPSNDAYADNDYEPHCEDEDFNMDCDYDPVAAKEQLQQELIENTKGKRKRKGRRNRFLEMIQTEKPVFNPDDEKTYAEYIDEYYKMDCEDIIGDLPCRFKYVETTPNDFGLTIEEILLAKNKELNQWASLKKAVQIRPDYVEKKEQRLYKMKAKNEDLKRKIFKSLYGDGSDNEEEITQDLQNNKALDAQTDNVQTTEAGTSENTEKGAGGKKRKKKKAKAANGLVNSNDKSLENAHSEQAKMPKLDETGVKTDATGEQQVPATETTTEPKKKNRKKNKKKTNNQQNEHTANTNAANTNKTNPIKSVVPNNKVNKNNAALNPFKASQNKADSNDTTQLPPTSRSISKNKKQLKRLQAKPNKFNKKQLQKKDTSNSDSKISNERLKAYGINPRKFHNKKKFGNKQNN